ncbi:MAG: MFS transporter [Chloroflexi bacterium]|nr:MFS transporter [Chloroflexota bacterium]
MRTQGRDPNRSLPVAEPRTVRRASLFVLTLLAIEFLDEFVFGVGEAAWPLIRDDLGINYAQIGLLLALPGVVSHLVEPAIGVLGDVWRRHALVLAGGAVFALTLFLTGLSQTFGMLLLAFTLMGPASGMFVTLSQATLMDIGPDRREGNMARWTLAGSLGVMTGSFVLGGIAAGDVGWRVLYLALAGLALIPLFAMSRFHPTPVQHGHAVGFRECIVGALRALAHRDVLRWLTLLEFSDLMLDVLLGYLALYFVDVVEVTAGWASLAVVVWTVAGLLGNLLLIPLLERIQGLDYLRASSAIDLVLFAGFLLVPGLWLKLLLLALVGSLNAGWYAVLQAQVYDVMPGMSGRVMTVSSVFGLLGSLLPWGLGMVANCLGLQVMMWLLLLGPAALLVGLPRASGSSQNAV